MKKVLAVLLLIYPFGILLTIAFILLCLSGFLRVKNWKKFPHFEKKLIVVFNHPSIIDQFIIAVLFFKGFFLNPFKYGPILVADRKNFYDSWYFFWLRPFMISVERENKESERAALLQMEEALNNEGIVVIAPEGGRTSSAKEGEKYLYSKKGKRIREFKNGVGLLVRKTGAKVLLLWVEGTDRFFPNSKERLFSFVFRMVKFFLRVGKLLHLKKEDFNKYNSREITRKIENEMLLLADK